MQSSNKLIRTLFVDPTDNIWLQLFRYGFVGGTAFVVDFGSLILLTEVFGLHYLVSATISFTLGLTVNYIISILWVFNTSRRGEVWKEFLIFAVIGAIGLGLNELIMYSMTDLANIHYAFSKLTSTAVVFFWNFFARKIILFNGKKR